MSEHVTSILRVRPSAEDDSVGEEIKLSVSPDGKTVTLPHHPAPPTSADVVFDRVYTTNQDNCAVYNDGVRKTVESTLLGYNGTVISLEVAGSHSEGSTLQDTIARAAKQIFVCLKKSKKSRSAANLVVNCSFVAVADDKAYDLLTSTSDHACEIGTTLEQEAPFRSLPFNDDCLQASIHEAKSQPQVLALLQRGHREEEKLVQWLPSQHQLGTAHRELSYHHTILSLTVEYTHFGTMNAPVSGTLSFVRLSSHHLLDQQDQCVPDQADSSLHTLVKVVSALTLEPTVEGGEGSLQSPPSQLDVRELYSKSLLTQILKEAIGGNCKTVFMCHIPESLPVSSLSEARAALQLVSRARHIQNKPNKRDLAERALMSAYMKQLRLQYDRAGGGEKEEEKNIASSDANGEEERQQAMELAATALAEAVEIGNHGDSEDEDDEKFSSRSDEKLWISLNIPGKYRQKKGHGSEGGATGASGVTIDALVGVLQDPDRGVPRALETRLQDVKIRRDVGALFSGAAIVKWMLGHVEGVETEDDAVTLGQLLLDEGAIFHSEGSMVFANADSLFYYAREARLGKRFLSQEEIQALLSHARDPVTTHVTSVPVREVIEEDGAQEDELCGGQGEFGGQEGDGGQGGYGGPEDDGGQGGYEGPEGDENQGVRGAGDGKSLNIEGEMDVVAYDPLNSDQVEQLIPLQGSDYALHPAVDQSDASGDGGEPADSRTSMESWMLDREETSFEEIDGQEGIGAEGREGVAEEGGGANRNPNTTLQHSIPSIHTLENSEDYPHPLHMAVAVGKHPGVIRNLVMMFGVDRTDDQGRTPLMFAALGNKRSSCSTLIECGAVVNTQDTSGLTALHVACYHGSKEATRVLLSKKATVTTADKMGHTALHWATIPPSTACLQLLLSHLWPELLKQVDCGGLTALHWAIFYNRPHHLKLLLKKYSDILEVDSSGRTLLTYSIERDLPNKDCINVLTESCPYLLSQRDTSGRLPLHVASMSSSTLPLSLLTTNRPPKSAPLEVNCVDPHMRTPLHYAAAANNLENAKVLLSVLADPQAVDSEGRTPLDYARYLEDGADIVELLQVAGGDAPLAPQTALGNTSPQLVHSLPAKLDVTSSATSSEFCTLL